MAQLEACVRSVQLDGLVWGGSKLVPVGYGIRKLQIQCVVEDDKVGTDLLEEEITKFEEHVSGRGAPPGVGRPGGRWDTAGPTSTATSLSGPTTEHEQEGLLAVSTTTPSSPSTGAECRHRSLQQDLKVQACGSRVCEHLLRLKAETPHSGSCVTWCATLCQALAMLGPAQPTSCLFKLFGPRKRICWAHVCPPSASCPCCCDHVGYT